MGRILAYLIRLFGIKFAKKAIKKVKTKATRQVRVSIGRAKRAVSGKLAREFGKKIKVTSDSDIVFFQSTGFGEQLLAARFNRAVNNFEERVLAIIKASTPVRTGRLRGSIQLRGTAKTKIKTLSNNAAGKVIEGGKALRAVKIANARRFVAPGRTVHYAGWVERGENGRPARRYVQQGLSALPSQLSIKGTLFLEKFVLQLDEDSDGNPKVNIIKQRVIAHTTLDITKLVETEYDAGGGARPPRLTITRPASIALR